MTDDPIVTAVRAVREELSRRLNYDVHAIFEDMRSREKVHGSRLVSPPREEVKTPPVSPAPPTCTPAK